jgi:hypothetical protein
VSGAHGGAPPLPLPRARRTPPLLVPALPPTSLSPARRGNIADVIENAAALAARTDTTVKKTGSQKRDIDYIKEYLGFVKEYEAGKAAADAAGTAFDEKAALAKVHSALEVEKADAVLDAAAASRKAAVGK